MSVITAGYVRKLLDYDPETGEFMWRHRPVETFLDGRYPAERECARWNSRFAGTIAGSILRDGYLKIKINGKPYSAHRLVWLWMTGEWPINQIDHIDCIRSNNRWTNLRAATHAQNMANRLIQRNNTSGYKGVWFDKRDRKWRVQIGAEGRRRYLGSYAARNDAAAIYSAAADKTFGEFARAK
jgi:hypothetical protein